MTISEIILICVVGVTLTVFLVQLSIIEVVPHIAAMLEYLENNQRGLD
jgi:hypothetical protein